MWSKAITRYIPHIQSLVQDGLAFTDRVTVVQSPPAADDQPNLPLHLADSLSDYERLTIFVGGDDQWQAKPAHLALVEEASRQRIIGGRNRAERYDRIWQT